MKVTRDEMLDALIQIDIETNSGENDWYLAGILRNGHKGYNELTDAELVEMLQSRDMDPNTEEGVFEIMDLVKRRGTY